MQHTSVLTIEKIKEIVSNIAQEYEVNQVFLFGSYARGEETPESDIDLRVETGNDSPWTLTRFYSDLVEALAISVDIIESDGCPDYLLNEIRKEEKLIYELEHKR